MSTKRRIAMAATLAVVFGATVSVVQWGPSMAQFAGGGTQVEVVGDVQLAEPVDIVGSVTATVSGNVQAFPPDGGVDVHVLSAPRLEATVSTDPGTWLAVANDSTGTRLQAEVTGPAAGPVTVAGVVEVSGYSSVPTVALENGTLVSLTSASLATLTATTGKGNCTYVDGDPTATIGTTAANIPASPLANRTAIEIFNHSTAPGDILLCSAQGTATITSAVRIESDHSSRKWEGLGAGVLVSCRCVTGTCTYNYQEEQCYQQ